MNLYKKCGKVEVEGVNKVVYSKTGTKKKYVVYKKRHISLTKYKKIKANNKKEKHSNKRNNKSGGLGTNLFRRNNNKTPYNFYPPERGSSSYYRLPSIIMNPAKWFSTPTKKPKDSHLNSANPNAATTRDDARKQSQQEPLLSTYHIRYYQASNNLESSLDNTRDIIRRKHGLFTVYHIIEDNEQLFRQIVECAILKGCVKYLETEDLVDYNMRIRSAVITVKDEILIYFVNRDEESSLFINKNGEYSGSTKRADRSLTNNLKEYFMKEFPPQPRKEYFISKTPLQSISSLSSYNALPETYR
jgi:hypothetical protein